MGTAGRGSVHTVRPCRPRKGSKLEAHHQERPLTFKAEMGRDLKTHLKRTTPGWRATSGLDGVSSRLEAKEEKGTT